MTAAVSPDGLAKAKSIAAITQEQAEACEKNRTLTDAVVKALWDSGLMHWMNPCEAKGSEPSMPDLLDTWQELARQDGSVGWISIANFPSAAFAAAYLPEAGFQEVFADHDFETTLGGQFAPNGMGVAGDGGYTLNGAWNFGSGTGHSRYVVAGFIPMDGDDMRMADDGSGMPDMMVAVLPREQVNFTDGWHVQGLKGTGSYDYNVENVFVPEHRCFPLFTRKPLRGGSLYRMGVMPLTGAGHAAWALGVSRGALDDIVQLAKEKTRMGDTSTLAHKLTFQRNLAHHEAQWRAAHALVHKAYSDVAKRLEAGDELTIEMRCDMRMAATFATEASREICEFTHLAAGTTAIREGSRLERSFRDMYTGTQHAFINERTYTEAASVMLGLIEDSTAL